MTEPAKSPFEPFFDEVRKIVREEIAVALSSNGHSVEEKEKLLTPEQQRK